MAIETELKLSFSLKDLPHLLEHPLLTTPFRRQKLFNTYFDTPELSLLKKGMAVRERRILRKTLLTVKKASASTGGLHERLEWEAPTSPGQFDFQTLIDDFVLAQELTLLATQLLPIFTTDFVRKVWQIDFRGSSIELAIDIGKVISKRLDGVMVDHDICEVELELLQGNPTHLFGLARVLNRKVRLHPGIFSKAEIGYRLYQNIAFKPVKPVNFKIDANATPIATFKAICFACLYHLQQNELGLLLDEDEEYIHQVRVAIRRIRSAIKFFSPVLPLTFTQTWNVTWKEIANALGDARNWDVFNSEIMPLLKQTFTDHPDIVQLEGFAMNEKRIAHERAIHVFSSKTYSVKLISFAEAVMTLKTVPIRSANTQLSPMNTSSNPPVSSENSEQFVTRLLKRQHRKLQKELAIPNRSLHESHLLRLQVKKIRYSFEFFTELFPKKKMVQYTKHLTRAQELLGQMNDLATAEVLLSKRQLPTIDVPAAWIIGRQSAYLTMMPKFINTLYQLKPPWQK